MTEDPDRHVAAVVEWASIVRPDYGTAGFALISEPGMELQWPDESWPVLSRFSGLDHLGAFNLNRKPGCIQAVNWLTVLGEAALAAIGGRQRLAERLSRAWSEIAPAGPGFSCMISTAASSSAPGITRRWAICNRTASPKPTAPSAPPCARSSSPDTGTAPATCSGCPQSWIVTVRRWAGSFASTAPQNPYLTPSESCARGAGALLGQTRA